MGYSDDGSQGFFPPPWALWYDNSTRISKLLRSLFPNS